MVEQVDREAAASGYFAWCSGNPVIPNKMKEGKADDHSMTQAFARHRQQAEQRMIDIAQACLDQGYPLAVALEMMKGQNDG